MKLKEINKIMELINLLKFNIEDFEIDLKYLLRIIQREYKWQTDNKQECSETK